MKDMEAFVLAVEKEAALWREFGHETKELKQVAEHNPAGFAAAVVQNTVRQLHELSDKLSPVLGVDLIALRMADGEARWQVGNIDAKDFFHMVSDLATFQALWRIFEYSQREDATPEGLNQEFFKARAGYPGRHAFTIHVVRYEARRAGKPRLVPDTMLAESLVALVSARTKLRGEKRDDRGLRERLAGAGGEGPENVRERLHYELPAEVEPLFYELLEDHLDPELRVLTNEARRRVRRMGADKDTAPDEDKFTSRDALEEAAAFAAHDSCRPPELGSYLAAASVMGQDPDLAAMWEAEKLKHLREKAGLSEQQWESLEAAFRLGSNKEAAEELGRSPQQVGKEKCDALKKLRRAAGL